MERYQSQLVDYSIAKSSASTCEPCSSKPTFIETTHSLSYTCGKTTKDCGVQQTIDLARYENVVQSVPYETPYNDSVLQSLLNIQPPKHPESTYDQVQSDFETQNSLDDKKSRVESLMKEIRNLSMKNLLKILQITFNIANVSLICMVKCLHIVEEVDPFVILQKPKFTSIEPVKDKPVKLKPVEIETCQRTCQRQTCRRRKPIEENQSKRHCQKVRMFVGYIENLYKYGIVQKVNPKSV